MKKINKKYIQIAVLALLVVCISLAFNHLLTNLSLPDNAGVDLSKVMLPIIDGCALAYFLNPLLIKIETRLMIPLSKKIKMKDIIILYIIYSKELRYIENIKI